MRQYRYDFVRAMACVLVVAVHCHFFFDASGPVSSWVYSIAIVPLMASNAIFFMLSGKFNLKERTDDTAVKRYYVHKARNILLPVLVLFLIRTLVSVLPTALDPVLVLKEFAKGTLFAFSTSECWFIFELMGMLVCAPFFAHALARMNRFEKNIFLGLGVAYNAACTLLEMGGHEFTWTYPFAGWLFYFLIGAFIEEYLDDARVRRTLYALAVPLILLTAWLMHGGAPRLFYETSPTFIAIALAIYTALIQIGGKLKETPLVSLIARHAFSIYLLHMLVLTPLLGVVGAHGGLLGVALWAVTVPIVFVLSLVLSMLVDTLVISPLKRVFDAIMAHVAPSVN